MFLCLALLGFVFTSIGQPLDQLIIKNAVNDVGKQNVVTLMNIVEVNSTDFIHVQNRITYTEYESWRMFELGYTDKATKIL